jgi:hypothetical protein
VNIHALISAILERLAMVLAFGLKGVSSIGRLKNVYLVLIVVSQLLLLMADAYYTSEAIMLSSTMIDYGLKL